jgi:ribosomal protein S27AE
MEKIGVLSWLLFGVVSAIVARKKGRSGCAWFVLGVLLGPFGLILAFAASRHGPVVLAPSEPSPLKSAPKNCPTCGELIPQETGTCRSCDEKASRRALPGFATESWICPRCGASNPNKSYACGNCGYSLE